MKIKARTIHPFAIALLVFAMVMSMVLFPQVTPKAAPTFSDVPSSHWAYKDIYYCVGKNLFAGTSETTFSPNDKVTKAQLAVILARYAGADISGGSTWYEKAAEWAKSNKIDEYVKEVPNVEMSRYAFAVWMYNLTKYLGYDVSLNGNSDTVLSGYTDKGEIPSYSETAMKWAVSVGLISGTSPTTLSPEGDVTRAQVATMLARYDQMDWPEPNITPPITTQPGFAPAKAGDNGAPVYEGIYEPAETGAKGTPMPLEGTSVNGVVLDYNSNWEQRVEFVRLVNEYRVENGLNELKMAENIMSATQVEAWAHEFRGTLDHESTNWIPWSNVYCYNAEIATTSGGVQAGEYWASAAFGAFKKSAPHNAIMLDPKWTYIGVGMVGNRCYGGFARTDCMVPEDEAAFLSYVDYDPLLHN